MNYYNKIESLYLRLTKSERLVADYILKERSNIIYVTLSELAIQTNVGEATIIRLCKKLDYDGFQALKLAIAKTIEVDEYCDSENYIDKIQFNFQQVVTATRDMIQLDQLNAAIQGMYEANRMVAFGVGSSGLAAEEFKIRFLRIGVLVRSIIDPHLQNMTASILNSKDIIIAFSLSGRTKDIIESVEIAKSMGASVIAVTNYASSPLAELADYVLLTAKKESFIEGGSLVAKISQLYIIDLLCTGYSLMDIEKAKEMKTKTSQSIIKKGMKY